MEGGGSSPASQSEGSVTELVLIGWWVEPGEIQVTLKNRKTWNS